MVTTWNLISANFGRGVDVTIQEIVDGAEGEIFNAHAKKEADIMFELSRVIRQKRINDTELNRLRGSIDLSDFDNYLNR